jgi:hypothetical protein
MLTVFAALALLVPVFMVPAAAAQAQEKYQREEVVYLDAEVRMIEGQPVLVVETEEGYENIPFELSGHLYGADGQRVALEMQGNSIILPTEDGPVAVPIEEFCVVMVDGQVTLLAEVNPWWVVAIPIAHTAGHALLTWYFTRETGLDPWVNALIMTPAGVRMIFTGVTWVVHR